MFHTKFQMSSCAEIIAIIIRANKLLTDRWILMGFELCNRLNRNLLRTEWSEPLVLSPENVPAIQENMASTLNVFSNNFKTCLCILLELNDCKFDEE